MKRWMLATGFVVALLGLLGWAAGAGAAVLADFSRPNPDDIGVAGFRLDTDQELTITAKGFGYRSGGRKLVLSNAWILDSSTRDVAWEMWKERDEWREKSLTDETYKVDLPAGTYEVYFSTYADQQRRTWSGDGFFNLWGGRFDRVLDDLVDNEDADGVDGLYSKFSLRVEGNGTALDRNAVEAAQERAAEGAIVSFRKLGDREYLERGFELSRSMKIHIYALGEGRDDGVYDYGWILNADTGERVWQFTYDDSHQAGGAKKNRLVDAVFEAPAGKYVAVYGTDDSHSYDHWNAAPPFDPAAWGMTIRAEDPSESKYASNFDYEPHKLENVVVELTKVGDDEFVHKGFTLKKSEALRIYALGEGKNGEMYDYGWIVDADTRERVWEMDYRDTEHAGGGDKNRVFDGVVDFDKGSYIVYYGTDDSHSYPHWNTAPPMDRERWGITIMGTKGFKKSDVTEYDEGERGDYLVRMTEMGDDVYRFEPFELNKQTRVHIVALGEGQNGRMYDYGWIEDAETGRVVWEMTYRKTRHAGGAQKNRIFSDTIVLDPGKYKVYYESDDSHSYQHWNASRPYEPEQWGISLRVMNKG